jgi:hypothetical protein
MKTISRNFAWVLVVLLAISSTAAIAAQAPQPAMKTFEGELLKIDPQAKMITVKGPSAEMQFAYTDRTEIVGAEHGIQGLADTQGKTIRVQYLEQEKNRVAARIEILPSGAK